MKKQVRIFIYFLTKYILQMTTKKGNMFAAFAEDEEGTEAAPTQQKKQPEKK